MFKGLRRIRLEFGSIRFEFGRCTVRAWEAYNFEYGSIRELARATKRVL